MEVYADYAATTPVKTEVVDAMMEIYKEHYGCLLYTSDAADE